MFRSLVSPAAWILLCAVIAGCKPASPPEGEGNPVLQPQSDAATNAQLGELSRRWLDGWLALNPVSATQIGKHDYDTEIDDLSAEGRQKLVEFSRKILAELDAVDTEKLSRENQIDAAVLLNQVSGDIWAVETLQSWAWDPQVYSQLAGGAIYSVMAREFAPLSHFTIRDALTHVAEHNAHHMGQVVLLRQLIGKWPPPDGSWTW